MKKPLDTAPWTDKLTAHVVDPHSKSIHGYDVENDLAKNYTFTATVLLMFTGELPSSYEPQMILETVLQFIAPSPINEAPAHAATLARACTAKLPSIIGIAASTLAEQARCMLEKHADLFTILESEDCNSVPECFLRSDNDLSAVRLRDTLLDTLEEWPLLDFDLSFDAMVIAALHYCGFKNAEQIGALMVWAKLPSVLAEALSVPQGGLFKYPVLLPPIEYVGGCPRMGVEEQILQALKGGELSMPELVTKVQEESFVKPAVVKAAVMPLISSEQVSLTSDRKLSLSGQGEQP